MFKATLLAELILIFALILYVSPSSNSYVGKTIQAQPEDVPVVFESVAFHIFSPSLVTSLTLNPPPALGLFICIFVLYVTVYLFTVALDEIVVLAVIIIFVPLAVNADVPFFNTGVL